MIAFEVFYKSINYPELDFPPIIMKALCLDDVKVLAKYRIIIDNDYEFEITNIKVKK